MLHKLEYCGQDGWIEFDCLAPPYGSIGTKVRARHTYKQDRSTPSRVERQSTNPTGYSTECYNWCKYTTKQQPIVILLPNNHTKNLYRDNFGCYKLKKCDV